MMDTEHLSIEANPTFADVRFLEDRLYEYNVEKTGADDGQWLAIFLRDAQQTIMRSLPCSTSIHAPTSTIICVSGYDNLHASKVDGGFTSR
jgi:hypothetical protein